MNQLITVGGHIVASRVKTDLNQEVLPRRHRGRGPGLSCRELKSQLHTHRIHGAGIYVWYIY